jgi:hypothetical protein
MKKPRTEKDLSWRNLERTLKASRRNESRKKKRKKIP